MDETALNEELIKKTLQAFSNEVNKTVFTLLDKYKSSGLETQSQIHAVMLNTLGNTIITMHSMIPDKVQRAGSFMNTVSHMQIGFLQHMLKFGPEQQKMLEDEKQTIAEEGAASV